MSSELWWHTNAKLITAMDLTTLDGWMKVKRSAGLPLSSGGIAGPRITTARMINTIESSATVLALLRFSMLR